MFLIDMNLFKNLLNKKLIPVRNNIKLNIGVVKLIHLKMKESGKASVR